MKPIKNVFRELEGEKGQIWAEAVARFRAGEPLYLTGEIEKIAKKEQEARLIIDPWESVIHEYMGRPIPKDWFDRTVENQRSYWAFDDGNEKEVVERDRICASEILTVCLGIEVKRQSNIDRKRVVDIVRRMSDYRFEKTIRFGKSFGRTSGFIRQNGCQTKMSDG